MKLWIMPRAFSIVIRSSLLMKRRVPLRIIPWLTA
jgi:hypothetical protein